MMNTRGKSDSSVVPGKSPNKAEEPVAEAMNENIKKVGLPQWSDADQILAKALQRELKVAVKGLASKLQEFKPPKDQKEDEDTEGRNIGPTGNSGSPRSCTMSTTANDGVRPISASSETPPRGLMARRGATTARLWKRTSKTSRSG